LDLYWVEVQPDNEILCNGNSAQVKYLTLRYGVKAMKQPPHFMSSSSTNKSWVLSIRDLLLAPSLRLAWIIIIVLSLINLIPTTFANIASSCQLGIVQYIIAPQICVIILVRNYRLEAKRVRRFIGFLVGAIAGAIPATLHAIAYFAYGRNVFLSSQEISIPQVTPQLLIFIILAEIFLWIGLVFISGISGWFATFVATLLFPESFENTRR
jgi:hypothetical protein